MTVRVTRPDFTIVVKTTNTEGHGFLSEVGTLWVEEQTQKLADTLYAKEKELRRAHRA